ncbi:MAG: zinc-dependent metalloprotease, partial [Bacteroidaceae bacterium]
MNKTIILKTRSNYMTADTLDAVYNAVKASSNDPIVAVFKQEKSEEGRNKIDVTEFLMSENILCLSPWQKKEENISNLNTSLSYIESIHSYPINTEIRSLRTYNISSSSSMHPTMTFGLNTSLYLLPKVPMQPRIFDPRVGFFTDGHYKYSDNQQQVERQTFVTRRRLEPKNAEDAARQRNGELIEPKQQIVYYIDPATPKQWRPYLIAGVNDWNEAFEQAGWKNAITALEWPENDSTMSMEDSRYSVIMYLASDIANAYGPQNHDPRSGEIIESHVGWYHNVMSLVHNWYQIQCGALDPEARNAKFSDELMGELIRFVSSHEIGHTLGLRHNFGASATVPTDSLRSNDYLTKNGFCPSIMDYARFNYVAQPQDGIDVKNLFPRINQYDKWAIEWAYKPIYEATDAESDRYILNKITTQKTNLDKRYVWFDGEGLNIDPRRQTEDLGDDAVKSGNLGIENLKRIAPYLREWNYWGNDNNDERVSEMYSQLITQYKRYCMHVTRNLSGVNHTPLAPEQKGVVFQYPPREKAASVVSFIEKQVIDEPRWLVDVPYADRVFVSKEDMLKSICGPIVKAI